MSTISVDLKNYEISFDDEIFNVIPKPQKMCNIKIGYLPASKLFVSEKYNDVNDSQCCICLNEIKKGNTVVVMPGCSHIFHKACLFNWVDLSKKTLCPYCRHDEF